MSKGRYSELEKAGDVFFCLFFSSLLISMLCPSLPFLAVSRTVLGTIPSESTGWTGQLRNTQ